LYLPIVVTTVPAKKNEFGKFQLCAQVGCRDSSNCTPLEFASSNIYITLMILYKRTKMQYSGWTKENY